MELVTQDLSNAESAVINHINRNRRQGWGTSLSAVFKNLRNSSHYSLFGDYPLLAFAIETMRKHGLKPSRNQIAYTMRQSGEFSHLTKGEKMQLLDQLASAG